MKIKSFLLSVLAGSALLSCSKDETTKVIDPSENQSYVAVDIVMPSNTATRASESDFESGSESENQVNSAVFLFFDAAGNGCVEPRVLASNELEWKTGNGGSVDKMSVPVLVLNPVQGVTPVSMVAVINPRKTYTLATKLSDLKADTEESLDPKAPLLMSNSVYANGNNTAMEIPLSIKNIATSPELAIANPVIIPVERVVAKVAITDGSLDIVSDPIEENIDGVKTSVKVVIKGWKTTTINPNSFLIKKINPASNLPWDWNDAPNTRSYWAESVYPLCGFTNFSYNDAVANVSNKFEYCYENTNTNNPTKLYVAAQIQDAQGNPVNLIEFRGTKYTKTGLQNSLANLLKKYFYQTSANNYTSILPEHISFVAGPAADKDQVVVGLATSAPATFYTVSNGVATDATEALKAELAQISIKMWNEGRTYFFTNIIHDKASKTPGVVRNHVYKLTITSIAGLGSPVFDPDKVVTPEKPIDENSYISAEVRILKWKIVSQDIVLE